MMNIEKQLEMRVQVWRREFVSNDMSLADAVKQDSPEGTLCVCVSATLFYELLKKANINGLDETAVDAGLSDAEGYDTA